MGHVTLWMQISLDGFVEGPDEQVHWPVVDEELCGALLDELRQADLLMYGRRTHDILSSFWPTADVEPIISPFYVEFARFWKQVPKLVFSRTMRTADWNTTVVGDDLVDRITELKSETEYHMVMLGGAETASVFLKHNLVDEYRLFVHPMLLGGGVPLFRTPVDTAGLQLVDVTTFDSAVVQMHYQQIYPVLC